MSDKKWVSDNRKILSSRTNSGHWDLIFSNFPAIQELDQNKYHSEYGPYPYLDTWIFSTKKKKYYEYICVTIVFRNVSYNCESD